MNCPPRLPGEESRLANTLLRSRAVKVLTDETEHASQGAAVIDVGSIIAIRDVAQSSFESRLAMESKTSMGGPAEVLEQSIHPIALGYPRIGRVGGQHLDGMHS